MRENEKAAGCKEMQYLLTFVMFSILQPVIIECIWVKLVILCCQIPKQPKYKNNCLTCILCHGNRASIKYSITLFSLKQLEGKENIINLTCNELLTHQQKNNTVTSNRVFILIVVI